MPKTTSFEAVKAEYAGLWSTCTIRPQHKSEVMAKARQIFANRPRYDDVSKSTGVPWFMIGIIHAMECTRFPAFDQHLHNGDSLKKKTWQIPAGRPLGEPPFTWDESAVDALTMKGKEFDKIRDWTLERVAHCLELYNGFGYRLYRGIHSPYLWSFTTAYTSGKYVADKVWSDTAVSDQAGAMALLKGLIEIDASQIDFAEPAKPVNSWPKAAEGAEAPPTLPRMAKESKTVRLQAGALMMGIVAKVQTVAVAIGGGVTWLVSQLPDITADASGQVSAVRDFAALVGARESIEAVAVTLGIVFVAWAAVRHLHDRKALKELKGE